MQQDSGDGWVLAKVRRHIRIFADLARLGGESGQLDTFLDSAVIQVARAIEIEHVKILRYRKETSDFIVAAGVGWKEGIVRKATLSADLQSAPGAAYHTAEAVSVLKLTDQNTYTISEMLLEHGIVSLANAPIMIDGVAWGVLEVDSVEMRDFSQDTIDFLIAAGALIGGYVKQTLPGGANSTEMAILAAEMKNRDVLLRELQHRVKNNFQLLLSSISIQKRRYTSIEAQRALDHVASRISAISLAHDQLTPRGSGQVVNLASYLHTLCASISYQLEDIAIEVDADPVEVTIDRALPIGLIVNEAVTNSAKHAFDSNGGKISIRLTTGVGYGETKLVISDNGHGIVDAQPGGSGLKLIRALARQIGAAAEEESSGSGTTTVILFPIMAV